MLLRSASSVCLHEAAVGEIIIISLYLSVHLFYLAVATSNFQLELFSNYLLGSQQCILVLPCKKHMAHAQLGVHHYL